MTQSHDGPATRLLDGRVLVAGGGAPDALPELYDPATGRWTTTRMVIHRESGGSVFPAYTATLLRDGRVLVAGGTGDDGIDLAAAELFDPTTGRWTATGGMAIPRSGHTATLLADGKVLVTGGKSDGPIFSFPAHTSAELYDPATGRWTATGSLAEARWGHTATLIFAKRHGLGGGRSRLSCGRILTSCAAPPRVYDPASQRWSTTGSMGEARWGHVSIVLQNGTVLVVGGAVNGSGSGVTGPRDL